VLDTATLHLLFQHIRPKALGQAKAPS
jgi:hypothetical protein